MDEIKDLPLPEKPELPNEIIPKYLYLTKYYGEGVSLRQIYLDFCQESGEVVIEYDDIQVEVGDDGSGHEFPAYAVAATLSKEVGTCQNANYDLQMNIYIDELFKYNKEMASYEQRNKEHKQERLESAKKLRDWYIEQAKHNLRLAGVEFTIVI